MKPTVIMDNPIRSCIGTTYSPYDSSTKFDDKVRTNITI